MKSIEMLNKRKTCRTCLKLHTSSKELISIFESEKFTFPPNSKNVQFSEMLSTISNHLCSFDDLLPKSICFACMNSVRSAYCFKLQSEKSYDTLIEQFGSGCANIKIENCEHVPDQQFEHEAAKEIGLDTEMSSIGLPPKIIDDLDIKLEPEEEEGGLLVEVTNISPIRQEVNDYNDEAYSSVYEVFNVNDNEYNEEQPDSEMESISEGKDIINEDKQSASGTSATDSGTCTNAEEPDLFTEKELFKLKCLVCSKQLYSVGSLKRHKRSHADTNCNFCRRKFSGKSTLKFHVRYKHPQKFVQYLLNGQTKAIVQIPSLDIPKCCSCNQMFCSMEALYQHHSDCDHKCIECNLVFLRRDFYFKHMSRQHGINLELAFECSVCFNHFVSQRGLTDHMARLHSAKAQSGVSNILDATESTSNIVEPSNETMIKEVELTKDEFIAKYVKVYQGDFTNCSICEMKFKNKDVMLHLVTRHVITKPFKCPFCPIRFQNTKMRLRHLHYDHPDGFNCGTCNIVYEHSLAYLEHMLDIHFVAVTLPNNEEEPDIELDDLKFSCNPTVYTKDQFLQRFTEDVSTETLKCVPCLKSVGKSATNFHLSRYHAIEMQLKCPFCIRCFNKFDLRTKHMKIFHPTGYYCAPCDVQFHHHILYAEHMQTAHIITTTTRPHPGEVDDLSFNDLLLVPVLTTQNRYYNESDYTYSTKRKRKAVKKIDERAPASEDRNKPLNSIDFIAKYITREKTNINIMTCNACVRSFHTKLLGSHLKSWHSTRMPYLCELCNGGYRRNENRIIHMRKEHPDDFKCNTCDLQFHKGLVYVTHMETQHNITVTLPKNAHTSSSNLSDLMFVAEKALTKRKNSIKVRLNVNKPGLTKNQFIKKYTKFTDDKQKLMCIPCNNQLITPTNIASHLKYKHSNEKPYKCALCKMDFPYPKLRTVHMSTCHSDDYRCQHCNVQYSSSVLYANHMNETHGEIVPASIVNDKVLDISFNEMRFFPHLNGVEETVEIPSLNNSLNCLECHEEFESPRSYRFHMRVHHVKDEDEPIQIKIEPVDEEMMPVVVIKQEPKSHSCDICQKSFVAVISLNAHKKFRHNIEPEVDIEPEVEIKSEVDIEPEVDIDDQIHIVNVRTRRKRSKFKRNIRYDCEICDVVLYRGDYLKTHIRLVHPGEYICPFCALASQNYLQMIFHMKTDHPIDYIDYCIFNDKDLFDCKKCCAKFSVEEHLKMHTNVKHDETRIVSNHCEICQLTYTDALKLNCHQQRKSHVELRKTMENLKFPRKDEEKEVKIRILPPRRNSVRSLEQIHQFIISKGDLLNCGICNSAFTHRKSLIRHLKTHKEVPTLDCPKCSLKFFIKTKYEQHLLTHSNSRCQLCDRMLKNNHNLMKHINVCHSAADNLTLKCGFCGIEHDNEDELTTHYKMHFEEGEETREQEEQSDNDSPYCKICEQSFKFKIILNIHNSMWHSATNPYRHKTRDAQQRIKKRSETNIIKFIKCKMCEEAFIKPDDLDEHMKTTHLELDTSEPNLIIDETSPNTSKTEFNCDKCVLNFPCQSYLTNHQMYFCKSSPKVVINISEDQNSLNEQ